ncbi:MAG: hypothetical protein ACTSX8_01430 [Alphaproteobacteria bacterium]
MEPYVTTLRIRLVNASNERGHWGKEAGRAEKQTSKTIIRIGNDLLRGVIPPGPPWRVTFVRLYPSRARPMDKDNLATACKHVQDGTCRTLGPDDGDETAYDLQYRQERAEKYGVRIEIEGKR